MMHSYVTARRLGNRWLAAALIACLLSVVHHAVAQNRVFTWERNNNGQLGTIPITGLLIPARVPVLSNIVSIAAGYDHALALMTNGTVWAWGRNDNGQLGDGSTFNSDRPIQVQGLTGVIAIAAGGYHCLALKSDGTVWAWGNNSSGQLGNGTTTGALAPIRVANLTNIVAITAGSRFSLALRSDSTVWAWGDNSSGQLGDGTYNSSRVPNLMTNLSGMTAISAGDIHSVALKNDGTVWTWGSNNNGELGNGTTNGSNVPQYVSGLTNVVSITAGWHQSFAIKSDHTVWAWGYDGYGQLGVAQYADYNAQLTPGQVIMPGITRIVGSGDSSLALVADPDPDLNGDGNHDLIWQNNQTGQHSVWYMSGTNWTQQYDMLGPAISTSWKVVGTADLNGDGNSDLIWQNAVTGQVTCWLMNGAQTLSYGYISGGVPTQWKIVGIADLNNDGYSDLIWQNTQSGDVTVWYMNGAKWTGNWDYVAVGIPTQWQIVGTADMDGDGYLDLIWQNTQTGDVTVWYMNGGKWTGNWDYLANAIPLQWHVVSIQDLVGDNQPNLIWQNTQTGDIVAWYMNGPVWTGNWSYIQQGVSTQWSTIRAH